VNSDNACVDMVGAFGLSEFCSAPPYACHAAFGSPRASCDLICRRSGLVCKSAFDDKYDDGRCPAAGRLPCSRALHSKVCHCEFTRCDTSVDCAEDSTCVAGYCRSSLNIPIVLANITGRQSNNWRPQRMQGAPPSKHMCKLVSRDVLVEADHENGIYAVHQLRFVLPKGAKASGPSAHVKVRAPDTKGQSNRVRAYSMLIDGKFFELGVKV
jgi:hypothetical protein